MFGEDVAHATCNLNASVGVGIQMGYTRERRITRNGTLHCTAASARHGTTQSRVESELQEWRRGHRPRRSKGREAGTTSTIGGIAWEGESGCVRLTGRLGRTAPRRRTRE